MMPMRSLLMLSILCIAPLSASAADYPAKPIRFIAGVVPGGATDILARAVGQRLSERFNQQVIIDNRPGANQTIAAEIVAKSAPDGYTLIMVPSGYTINPSIYKLRFDPLKDLTPVGIVANVPNVMVVHPSIPVRTVKDFIAYARTRPGEINYGSSGVGSPSHLSGELFDMYAKIKTTHVPYKGQGAAMIDLLGGHLKLAYPSIPSSIQQIKAGKIIALGVTPKIRSSALPDIPTLDEAGVPGYEVSGWYGVLTTGGTPRSVITTLNSELKLMLETPNFRDMLSREGADPLLSTPEEFGKAIAADIVKWSKVVKTVGIKGE